MRTGVCPELGFRRATEAEMSDSKPELPKKVDVELDLEDLDKVSGGTGIGGAIRGPQRPVGPVPTEPTVPSGPGIFQIEAV
jgi:hypothetical protein